ncbi:MAG: CoA-disulfide reductase [Solirubrobacterales bacterium]
MSKLIVIGGVAAGMSAAAKAKRMDKQLAVQVYAAGDYISYGGCGLPYYIGGFIPDVNRLVARTPEQMKEQGIDVKVRHEVTAIDPDQQKVTILDRDRQQSFEEEFDQLIIASGASAIVPPMPGIDLDGVFQLRTIPDAVAIRSFIDQYHPRQAVIVGGGFIGLEMVENLQRLGCQVTIVEKAPQLLTVADADMAGLIQQYLEETGVKMALGVDMQGIEGDKRVRAVLTDRGPIEAELVLLSIGVKPNSEIAAAAGIELGIRNAIQINERCETNIAGIYAAGDCATVRHLVSGRDTYIPMGSTANKQGKVAGENAAGGRTSFRGVVGTGIARISGREFARTGLSERECKDLGFSYIAKKIEGQTAASYCPGATAIQVKLIAEGGTGRILGGQIAGGPTSAKRIDVIALAIASGSTVADLVDMDLAYSPPFGPVWDPLLVALNQF